MQAAPIVWSDLAITSPSMQINLRHRRDDLFGEIPAQSLSLPAARLQSPAQRLTVLVVGPSSTTGRKVR